MGDRWTWIGIASMALALSASGCQRMPYELVPVVGTVTIDGHPLSQAKVMFAPIETGNNPNPGKPAFGLLQSDGSFVLTTYMDNDGAVVGEHWLTIISLAKKAAGATLANNPRRDTSHFSRLTVPRKVKVVADQENKIDIELTAQDVARYGVKLAD